MIREELTLTEILSKENLPDRKKQALIGFLKHASSFKPSINILTDKASYIFIHEGKEYVVQLKGFWLIKSPHTKNQTDVQDSDNWLLVNPKDIADISNDPGRKIVKSPIYLRVENNTQLIIKNKNKVIKFTNESGVKQEGQMLKLMNAGKEKITDTTWPNSKHKGSLVTMKDKGIDLSKLKLNLSTNVKVCLSLILITRLKEMHDKKVAHDDVRAPNIAIPVVNDHGQLKLDLAGISFIDFGNALKPKTEEAEEYKDDVYKTAMAIFYIFKPDLGYRIPFEKMMEIINDSSSDIPKEIRDTLHKMIVMPKSSRISASTALEEFEKINQKIGIIDKNIEKIEISQQDENLRFYKDLNNSEYSSDLDDKDNLTIQEIPISIDKIVLEKLKLIWGDGRKGDSRKEKKVDANALMLELDKNLINHQQLSSSEKLGILELLYNFIKDKSSKLYTHKFTFKQGEKLTATQIEHIKLLQEAYYQVVKNEPTSTEIKKAVEIRGGLLDFSSSVMPTFFKSSGTNARKRVNQLLEPVQAKLTVESKRNENLADYFSLK